MMYFVDLFFPAEEEVNHVEIVGKALGAAHVNMGGFMYHRTKGVFTIQVDDWQLVDAAFKEAHITDRYGVEAYYACETDQPENVPGSLGELAGNVGGFDVGMSCMGGVVGYNT